MLKLPHNHRLVRAGKAVSATTGKVVTPGPAAPASQPRNRDAEKWAELHLWVLTAPDEAAGRPWLETFLGSLGTCGGCQRDARRYVRDNPPRWGPALFTWSVAFHNHVNRKIGRPEMTEANARRLWDIGGTFDAVYVLSLPQDGGKRERFFREIDAIGWPFSRPEVVDGIDGPATGHPEGATGGCRLGHAKMLKAAMDAGHRSALFLEDDATFAPGFVARVADFLFRCPPDADGYWLGHQNAWWVPDGRGLPLPVAPGIVRTVHPHRAHAYALKGAAIRAAYERLRDASGHADHLLGPLGERFDLYAPDPPLAGQAAGYSRLMNRQEGVRFWESRPTQRAATGEAAVFAWNPPDPARVARRRVLRSGGVKRVLDVGNRNAFNATAFDVPEGKLCVFRSSGGDRLRWVMLDPDLSPLPENRGELPLNQNDDPRVIRHGGKLYLSTNYWWGAWSGGRMELREMEWDGRAVALRDVGKFDTIDDWPGYSKPSHEKNWAPFSRGGEFYYVYSVNPHRILRVDLPAGRASLAHWTEAAALPWSIDGGSELRCSAPPVLMGDGAYLSTFHVRRDRDYFSGFYRFAGAPPFRVLSMSAAPVLWPEDSEGVCWRNNNFRLLFIQGMDVDEPAGRVRLWGGDNDHSVVTVDLELGAVLAGLEAVPVALEVERGHEQHDNGVITEVQREDCYRVRELAAAGFRPSTVVDLGAHIGTFSTLAARAFPGARVFSFEAGESRAAVLRRNAAGLPVAVFNDAVVGFYGREDGQNVYRPQTPYEGPYRRREKANAVNVGQLYERCGIDRIDFLKIDVEECEVNIIRELDALDRLKDIAVISGEWHFETAKREVAEVIGKTHEVWIKDAPECNHFHARRRGLSFG